MKVLAIFAACTLTLGCFGKIEAEDNVPTDYQRDETPLESPTRGNILWYVSHPGGWYTYHILTKCFASSPESLR